jgi:LmbE family N-acetylglucosaminyl deacetylase
MEPIICNSPLPIESLNIPKEHCILVLAPHPDDFDAIGLTMRFFQVNGNPLYVTVATSGVRGVEDSFCSPPTLKAKSKIREQEQMASCQFFGLPATHLTFIRLEEDNTGQLLENKANVLRVKQHLLKKRPAVVLLPHWHDTNLTHQRVYSMFHKVALGAAYPLAAFLNRDPKTIQMRCDMYLGYTEAAAAWKGELLRFHRSQQQRNLNNRGYGMDERILKVDRHSAEACSTGSPYAEIFEIKLFGATALDDVLG